MSSSGVPLDGDSFCAMVVASADVIETNAAFLSRLDAVSGDGDHGANAQRAMNQTRTSLDALDVKSPALVLGALASACAEAMGGASGAVFAAFFAGVAASIGDESTVNALALADSLAAGLERVQRIGGAEVGDKTVVDALAPAVAAAASASRRGTDVGELLAAAATAARAGADATRELAANVGRARYAEAGGRGTADAGATTIALMFESWADAVDSRRLSDLSFYNSNDPSAVSPGSTDRRSNGRH